MEAESSQEDLAGVIGIACRVPGASSVSELWKVLDEQPELRQKIPKDRFDVDAWYHPIKSTKGKTNAQYAYFMDGSVKAFDAGFFKISRKEAEAMDPQQRIILEVVYEALENAGITLEDIAGTTTSVYCGSSTEDYSAVSTTDMADYPTYANTGTGPCIMANRVSYFFDLKGESILVNTACSSALVCLHLASESIKSKCSDMSIVVGSSLLLEPRPFVTMADFGMLSTDGHSRAFDKAGQGFVRGEGVCAVVLKSVKNAQADGDTIKAVIRGSYTNHDGKKSGLTVPSADAQVALIRKAYERAAVSTRDTDFIEAHGTGTPVGDPIEAAALQAVFGASDKETPTYVGSVKTVIGHLEGAAGLISVIKAIMSVQRGTIFGNKHLNNPRQEFSFNGTNLRIPTRTIPWPRAASPRRASVNSFGYGGSNAHCIIEEYRPCSTSSAANSEPIDARTYLIPLSAHTTTTGTVLVDRIFRYFQANPSACVSSLSNHLSMRRTVHDCRAYLLAKDRNDVLSKLSCLVSANNWNQVSNKTPRLGFVFTGQGAQWARMGVQLLYHFPHFGEVLSKCQAVLDQLEMDAPTWSIKDELERPQDQSKMNQGEYSQPICTAIQIGLVEVLALWNIVPSAVIGHSSGEIAAAFASGRLSLKDAMVTAFYRGLYTSSPYQARLKTPKGAMLAVGLPESSVQLALQPYSDRVNIAAVNSPSLITVSGDADAIEELSNVWNQQGVFNRRLPVDQAYHSPHMRAMSGIYFKALKSQGYFSVLPGAVIPMHSSLTGKPIRVAEISPQYWVKNMVAPVRFQDALIDAVLDENSNYHLDALIEIGPHPALKKPTEENLKFVDRPLPYISTLSRNVDDIVALLNTAGELFKLGCSVHLENVFNMGHTSESTQGSQPTRLENFPTYPWDHAEYWHQSRMTAATFNPPYHHSLLGAPTGGSTNFCLSWRNVLRLRDLLWLPDHKVQNAIVFPASGYISVAVEAVFRQIENINDAQDIVLNNVSIISGLVVPDDENGIETIFQLARQHEASATAGNVTYTFCFSSFDRQSSKIKEHCTGQISVLSCPKHPAIDRPSSTSEQKAASTVFESVMSKAELYERFRSLGLQYGHAFRLVEQQITYQAGVAKAAVRHETAALCIGPQDHCILHPTFFDAVLHPLLAAIEGLLEANPIETTVPKSFGSIRLSKRFFSKTPSERATYPDVLVHSKTANDHEYFGDLVISESGGGEILISVKDLRLVPLDRSLSVAPARKVFSKLRWLPAFSLLSNGSKELPPNIHSAIDVFCHEFPKANILLICDKPQTLLRDLLTVICNGSVADRRFAKLTIPSFRGSMESIGLTNEFKCAIESDLPSTKTFELAVVLTEHTHDLHSLVMDAGWVLTTQGLPQQFHPSLATFEKLFSRQELTCFRYIPSLGTNSHNNRLEIIHSDSQGGARFVFQQELRRQFSPSGTNIKSVGRVYHPTAPFVVVITSLCTDFLWEDGLAKDDPSSRSDFAKLKNILLMEDKTILWILRGATLSAEKPQQAMILGMIRVARNENPGSRIITLDTGPSCDVKTIAKYTSAILGQNRAEDEYVIHGDTIQIPRLYLNEDLNAYSNASLHLKPNAQHWFSNTEFVLRSRGPQAQPLEFISTRRDHLADHQLEIQVHASSIMPKDILDAQQRSAIVDLGGDCAGVVKAKGGAVPDSVFQIGDKVYFWAQSYGTHRNVVRVSSLLCVRLAKEDDLATCASWYKELALAKYAVFTKCRVAARDRVFVACTTPSLMHLVIHMCEALNASVTVVTTKLDDKSVWKSQYPNLNVVTQRDGTLQRQKNRNALFDVIVHEICGQNVNAFVGLLAPRGRYLGIQSEGEENLKPSQELWPSTACVDFLNLATRSPQAPSLVAQLIQSLPQFLRNNSNLNLRPPTFEKVSFADCNDAYRLAERLQAVRKVVLIAECAPEEVQVYTSRSPIWKGSLDRNKIYLLVGGFSGLGCALALWLARKGARHLAFLSRSGKKSLAAQGVIEHLQQLGVEVCVYEGDVTHLQTVQDCIDALPCQLGGVFHMAMLLKDNPISTMSYKLWHMSTQPKARGAINLCVGIGSLPIDFFICFSSTSAIFGPPGQANYTAGNCFMDTLMRQRRLKGLPGTTLNIGMITDVGVVSGNHLLLNRMRAQGFDPLTIYDVYAQVEAALAETSPLQAADAVGFECHQIISGAYATSADIFSYSRSICQCLASILDNASRDFSSTTARAEAGGMASDASKDPAENATPIDFLVGLIASITGLLAANISVLQPLTTYGIDSISGGEVRTKIRNATGIEIALFEILGGVTIANLAERITMPPRTTSPLNSRMNPSASTTRKMLSRPIVQVENVDDGEIYEERPLSPYQMICYINRETPTYNKGPLLSTYELYGAVRPEVLKSALLELIKRNPILRTVIFEESKKQKTTPFDADTFALTPHLWQFKDFTGEDAPSTRLLREELSALRGWRFHPKVGLSIRVLLVRLRPLCYSLTFATHRLITDSKMPREMFNQFTALCDCFAKDHDPDAIEYSNIHIANSHPIDLMTAEKHMRFWVDYMSRLTKRPLSFPFVDRKRADVPEFDSFRTTLSSEDRTRMATAGTKAGLNAEDFLLSVFMLQLARTSGAEDVLVYIKDRMEPTQLGFNHNLLPLKCSSLVVGTFEDVLSNIKRELDATTNHHGIPLVSIIERLGPIGSSLFSRGTAGMVYGSPRQEDDNIWKTKDFGAIDRQRKQLPQMTDIQLYAEETQSKELELTFCYRADIYEWDKSDSFFKELCTSLHDLIDDPRQPLDDSLGSSFYELDGADSSDVSVISIDSLSLDSGKEPDGDFKDE